MKVDHPVAKRAIDAMFALRVSLRSFDYHTEEDLKSFGLAPVDDEDDVGPLPMVLSSSTMVPLKTVSEVMLSTSPVVLGPLAIVGLVSAP